MSGTRPHPAMTIRRLPSRMRKGLEPCNKWPKPAVEKAVQAGSNYDTLTYAPTDQQWKGDYRRIQVMAAKPGLTLAYRRGYFADDPKAPPRPVTTEGADADRTAYSAMRSAMVQGGPEPTEIIFAAT